jgi:tRNA-dihydrouridine synthase A
MAHLLGNQTFPEISVAPMMDLTDHHCRYFLRLLSPHIKLYTEMVTTNALMYGDQNKLLRYNPEEQPLAIQIAGNIPKDLAYCAKLAEQYGFMEVNINIGCPSDRVQKAKIGACLMAEPDLVADGIKAMLDTVAIPVTVKTRIGIDDFDSYDFLYNFIKKIADAGCTKFIIHARKAWLNGLNPKQNRTVPQLDYAKVYRIKQDFPNLSIILNGGIETVADIKNILPFVDGVMIGRAAYYNPYLLAEIDQEIFGNQQIITRYDVVENLYPYIYSQLEQGTSWVKLARHYMGLFKGQPGARLWRQFLSESRTINHNNLLDNLNKIINYLKLHEAEKVLSS